MPVHSPIVVLDSGLGGLTVVRALRSVLPAEDVVYFGDTARLPYGSKTAATVTDFVRQIINYLRPYDAKHVVLACNTATALALPAIRAEFSGMSISGVVEPGAKAAVVAAGARRQPIIGVLATEATIRSKAYERAILRRRSHARLLLKPAPLLVPIIEEGRRADDPLIRLALQQYLRPLTRYPLDVLVLGCTHYPILKDAIAGLVGPVVRVIDSADQCAQDVARRLRTAGLLRAGTVNPASDDPADTAPLPLAGRGSLRCLVTDNAPRFATLAGRFLGEPIDPPTAVLAEDLYAPAEAALPIPLRRPA